MAHEYRPRLYELVIVELLFVCLLGTSLAFGRKLVHQWSWCQVVTECEILIFGSGSGPGGSGTPNALSY